MSLRYDAKFERLFILSNANIDFWRLVFRQRREVFILLAMPPPSLGRAALVMWCGWFKLQPQTKGTVLLVCICQRQTKRTVPLVCDLCGLLEIRHATALTTGAKHWHRQKAVFFVFVSVPQYSPQFNSSEVGKFTSANVGRDGAIGDLAHSRRLLITFSVIYKI